MIEKYEHMELEFTPPCNASLPLDYIENGHTIIDVDLVLTFQKLQTDADNFKHLVEVFYSTDPKDVSARVNSFKRVDRIREYIFQNKQLECPVLERNNNDCLRIIDGRHRILYLKELIEDGTIINRTISVAIAKGTEEYYKEIQSL